MILAPGLAPLFGAALVATVATGPLKDSNAESLSPQQKSAVTQPLVRSATECIIHAVVADPRYATQTPAGLGDLIVASIPACVTTVRAMIDAFDRFYGEGSGEAFFMGPYLDVLPKAVADAGKKNSP